MNIYRQKDKNNFKEYFFNFVISFLIIYTNQILFIIINNDTT